jgi:hypothetical protein
MPRAMSNAVRAMPFLLEKMTVRVLDDEEA